MIRWVDRIGFAAALAALLTVSGCRVDGQADDDPDDNSRVAVAHPVAQAGVVIRVGDEILPPPRPEVGAAWLDVQPAVASAMTAADQTLRKVPDLTRQERSILRLDVSAVQLVRAHELGIPQGSDLQQMIAAGRVVQLPEVTRLWVLRDMKYSQPYLVPSAAAMLIEIGQRFQARLDSLGLPRFRLEVTSALRTADTQAALRRRNRNAAPSESTHEFGTTIDIAYRKFSPPLDNGLGNDGPALNADARMVSDSMWMLLGRQRSAELQAVLGRVLQEMRIEGKLLTRMERNQPVYHTTVAKVMSLPQNSRNTRAQAQDKRTDE
jgi:hypothetical protein